MVGWHTEGGLAPDIALCRPLSLTRNIVTFPQMWLDDHLATVYRKYRETLPDMDICRLPSLIRCDAPRRDNIIYIFLNIC